MFKNIFCDQILPLSADDPCPIGPSTGGARERILQSARNQAGVGQITIGPSWPKQV